MSEYWVSQGRRMCPYCKCWTADNKASINFHEQGKNHKENVKKKLDELRKKGLEDARKKEKESSDLAKIEKAAMASFKKDMANNEGVSNAYGAVTSIPTQDSSNESKPTTSTKPNKPKSSANKPGGKKSKDSLSDNWSTAYTDDGHLYYWNSVTNETSWYPPETSDQKEASTAVSSSKKVAHKPAASKNPTTGYGQWETVAIEPKESVTDYDLPTDSKNVDIVTEDIPLPSAVPESVASADSEPSKKFKEKRVSLATNSKEDTPVAFKKVKMSKKRQTRAALDDE